MRDAGKAGRQQPGGSSERETFSDELSAILIEHGLSPCPRVPHVGAAGDAAVLQKSSGFPEGLEGDLPILTSV
jgi:hypothetical protein